MQPSGTSRQPGEGFDRELRRSLYRFDCPDAHTLGEFHLEMLGPDERMRTCAHVAECDQCSEERRVLRWFLTEPLVSINRRLMVQSVTCRLSTP